MLHPRQAKPVLSILLLVIVLPGDCQIFTIDKPIANYGDDLTLFCKVDNCCRTTSGWEKWIPELKPIIFDIRGVEFTASYKYTGIVSQSGYTLTIRNLTKDDINIGYSCLYGFKRSAIKLLTADDVFLRPNLTIVRKISSYGQDLELYCEIGNCCNKTSEWEIWDPLLRIISQYIKDQNLSAISKYAVTSSYNGYSLVIRNVSVDDLNKTYSCLYGFTRSNKLVLLKNDVFKSQIFTIDKPIANYGDDLTLFCKVDNCCRTTSGWEKWIPELKPIIFDIRGVEFTASFKYTGIVSQSGYTLTIRNLTKDDINIGYSCLYGFKRSAIKLLTADDVFLRPNVTIVRKISSYGQDLELYCDIGNCCSKTLEWEIWEPLLRTISQDIKEQTLSAISKYAVNSSYNGYSLVIRNVSVDDLNKTYSCLYGFTRSNKLVLLKNDVFKKYVSVEDNDGDNNNVLITCVVIAAVLIVVCGIATRVVFLIARRQKKNKREKTLEDTELLPMWHMDHADTNGTEEAEQPLMIHSGIPEDNDSIHCQTIPGIIDTTNLSMSYPHDTSVAGKDKRGRNVMDILTHKIKAPKQDLMEDQNIPQNIRGW